MANGGPSQGARGGYESFCVTQDIASSGVGPDV
jgi:hypothetical protein